MLSVYYRFCPRDNNRSRPIWYSKLLCFRSFIDTYVDYQQMQDCQFFFIVDDAEHFDSEMEAEYLSFLKKVRNLEVVKLNVLSNTKSYIKTYSLALATQTDYCIFVEDDYLWQTNALSEMMKIIKLVPDSYVTPYDHPVRYDESYEGGADLPHWYTQIRCTDTWHFRSQESTCMTFLSRHTTLREDKHMHMLYSKPEQKVPNDRELFRNLQGLGSYTYKLKRLLLGPVPSLATHAHLPYLAPAINWDKIARKYNNN